MNKQLYNGDCLELLQYIPSHSVDLVVTDPPYLLDIRAAMGGGRGKINSSAQKLRASLIYDNLVNGYNPLILDELIRVMKVINCYIWCNDKQIPMYIDKFVREQGCLFDILVWIKSNPLPKYNNHYLMDKEYCLYFREKKAYCSPSNVEMAKTYSFQQINVDDKKSMFTLP